MDDSRGSNRPKLVVAVLACSVLGACLLTAGGTAVYLALGGKRPQPSGTGAGAMPGGKGARPAGEPGARSPSPMDAFFAANRRPDAPLTRADLEKLVGSWEARYVSLDLGQAPVDAAALPPTSLTIESSGAGVRLRVGANGAPRGLSLDGGAIRAAPLAGRPELSLRIDGAEIVGELEHHEGDSKFRAEFRARRRP